MAKGDGDAPGGVAATGSVVVSSIGDTVGCPVVGVPAGAPVVGGVTGIGVKAGDDVVVGNEGDG